jgi:hypothetical protein
MGRGIGKGTMSAAFAMTTASPLPQTWGCCQWFWQQNNLRREASAFDNRWSLGGRRDFPRFDQRQMATAVAICATPLLHSTLAETATPVQPDFCASESISLEMSCKGRQSAVFNRLGLRALVPGRPGRSALASRGRGKGQNCNGCSLKLHHESFPDHGRAE